MSKLLLVRISTQIIEASLEFFESSNTFRSRWHQHAGVVITVGRWDVPFDSIKHDAIRVFLPERRGRLKVFIGRSAQIVIGVIGDGDDVASVLLGSRDYLSRFPDAVRKSTVTVQVRLEPNAIPDPGNATDELRVRRPLGAARQTHEEKKKNQAQRPTGGPDGSAQLLL